MPELPVNGTSLYYHLSGSGHPLVMIAGLGADHTDWGFQMSAFRREYRCLVFDNRGSGRSGDGYGDLTIPQLADDAAGLMDVLGLGAAHILGASMGGVIAMELALRHPDKVRSLALTGTWARPDGYLVAMIDVLARIGATAAAGADIQPVLRRLMFLLSITPDYFDESSNDCRRLGEWALARQLNAAGFVKQARACLNHDCLARLPSIAAPVLVTAGDRDVLTPLRFSEAIHEAIPDSRLAVFKGSGHAVFLQDPAAFNQAHIEFWRELPPWR